MRACNRCGADIGFRKHRGAWRPSNPNGAWHNCRTELEWQADKILKADLSGKPLSKPPIRVTGTAFQPFDCACDVPPWDHCPCTMPGMGEPSLRVLMGEAVE